MSEEMQERALVTGAGRRVGRALALALARAGHDVVVHHNTSGDEAEQVVNEIRSLGRNAQAVQADLLSESDTEALVGRAVDAIGGPLTVLVNNASIFEHDNIETATRESWDRHIGSNLRAPFVLTQRFAAQAPRATVDEAGEPLARALVVNLIDQRVHKPTPEFMTYTIAKMGLWAFTRTAAQALAPDIRVNGIGPGPTVRGVRQSEEHFQAQRAATILGRGADERDVIAALNYLLSARSVTGQMICVDGGQHLAWQTPDVLGAE